MLGMLLTVFFQVFRHGISNMVEFVLERQNVGRDRGRRYWRDFLSSPVFRVEFGNSFRQSLYSDEVHEGDIAFVFQMLLQMLQAV